MRQTIQMERKNNNKTFDQGYDEFILNCRVRNLSPETIKHYDSTMMTIYKFIPPKTPIKDITINVVNNFILSCKSNLNVKDVTINTYLRGLRAVMYYFMKLGYLDEFKITNIKFDKHIIETYTDSELKLLLKKPSIKKCTFTEYRSWVLVNFLLGTGCRVGSLVEIRNKDIDFENAVVSLNVTKNRKPLLIPLSNTLVEVLKEYMNIRCGEENDYLFCTAYGEKANRQTISVNVNNYNRKCGVMKTGLHRFRHTFAKKWINSGGDIFRLQKILGHSSLDVVRNYVNMFTNDLQDNFNTFSPLENIARGKEFIKVKYK